MASIVVLSMHSVAFLKSNVVPSLPGSLVLAIVVGGFGVFVDSIVVATEGVYSVVDSVAVVVEGMDVVGVSVVVRELPDSLHHPIAATNNSKKSGFFRILLVLVWKEDSD